MIAFRPITGSACLAILITAVLRASRSRLGVVSIPPAVTVGAHLRLLAREPAAWGIVLCGVAFWAMALAVQSLVRKMVQHPEFAGLLREAK